MPRISQTFNHTLNAIPTKITPRYIDYSTQTESSTKPAGTAGSVASQISALFYKDLKDFITSINDFPFSTEFEEDSEIHYANATLCSKMKIGNMSYCPQIRVMASNSINYYFPEMACYYFQNASSKSNLLRPFYNEGNATYFYTNVDIKTDSTQLNFKYTLHAFYNTDYVVIAFTTDTLTIITPILTQVSLKDRFGDPWYLVTSTMGDDSTSGVIPYTNYQFYRADRTETGLIASSNLCIQTDYDEAKLYDSLIYPVAPTGSNLPIEVIPSYTTATTKFILSPASTQVPSAIIKPDAVGTYAEFTREMSTNNNILISSPIYINGYLYEENNQILCASNNAATNKEYEIDNKTYFSFGSVEYFNVPMPFLFEI